MKNNNAENQAFISLVMYFPKNFIKNVYPHDPRHHIAVIAMDQVCEGNRDFGNANSQFPKKSYFRHDAIFSFLPGANERKNSPLYDYHYRQVTIEIKLSAKDLQSDDKILQYLGAVQYSFIAVPSELIQDAVRKIRGYDNTYVGLINIDSGDIVIMPDSQEDIQVRERQDRLLANMHANPKWYDNPAEVYKLHHFETGILPPDKFVEHDGLRVNAKYL